MSQKQSGRIVEIMPQPGVFLKAGFFNVIYDSLGLASANAALSS